MQRIVKSLSKVFLKTYAEVEEETDSIGFAAVDVT